MMRTQRTTLIFGLVLYAALLTSCNLSRKKATVDSPNPPQEAGEMSGAQTMSETDGTSSTQSPTSGEPSKESGASQEDTSQAALSAPIGEPARQIWGYSGLISPENWANLDSKFKTCGTGQRQSPIDLKWRKPKANGELKFSYLPGPLALVDTGHTLQILFAPGSRAELHGKSYNLTHLDIRSSSEHTLSNNTLPLELQFFHRSDDGEIAALSVIVIEGSDHPTIDKIFSQWPEKKMSPMRFKEVLFDPQGLLPGITTHYAYEGSLTYPPCTEGVKWFVLNTPVSFSRGQIVKFRENYSANARPPQPLNGRKVNNY